MSTLQEVYDKGYRRACINCHTVWKPDRVRTEPYETGHGYEYPLEMCKCGCDLIGYIVKNKKGELEISQKDSK